MFIRTCLLVLFVGCMGLSEYRVSKAYIGLDSDYTDYGSIVEESPKCGPNEVLSHCVKCPSEDSCYDRDQILCPAVIMQCRTGCVCKEGFIRKTLGSECIPKEECGVACVIFEQYTECRESTNETCSSLGSPPKSINDIEGTCTPGCSCWDGYYRADENSPCLHRCFCPELKHSPDCAAWNTPL